MATSEKCLEVRMYLDEDGVLFFRDQDGRRVVVARVQPAAAGDPQSTAELAQRVARLESDLFWYEGQNAGQPTEGRA